MGYSKAVTPMATDMAPWDRDFIGIYIRHRHKRLVWRSGSRPYSFRGPSGSRESDQQDQQQPIEFFAQDTCGNGHRPERLWQVFIQQDIDEYSLNSTEGSSKINMLLARSRPWTTRVFSTWTTLVVPIEVTSVRATLYTSFQSSRCTLPHRQGTHTWCNIPD